MERGSSDGVGEVVEERRKSCRHPVDPATASREGSCGEKWRSRIAYGVGVVEMVMLVRGT